MMKRIYWMAVCLMCTVAVSAQERQKGFYKDLFMDSGIMLTSRADLPAARLADLSMESFVSTAHSYTEKYSFTDADTILQNQLIGGSAIDENGILLYPDGAPRFRVVYMNGGRAKSHGTSLGEQGRANYRTFVAHGGSYVGSCAGAFIASVGTKLPDKDATPYDVYLGIWPGYTTGTGLEKSWTHVDIEPGSPLLRYYRFAHKMNIDSVRHNGGCFANMKYNCPEGTEVLARYSTPGDQPNRNIIGEPVIWAYKASDATGRIVLCGSHPEGVEEGARLELTSAMLKYAMDGVGKPVVKGELKSGEPRRMDCHTHDGNPDYARIGDKQYHHFTVQIPEGADSVKITLSSVTTQNNFDVYLFANDGSLAFKDEAEYSDLTLGINKELVIGSPKAGTLFVSVFCDTTVEALNTRYGTQYSERLDVLNGVPYSICATVFPRKE